MDEDRRGAKPDRRKERERRGGAKDRRNGQSTTREVPYSELRDRIEAGQVQRVTIGPRSVSAEPLDTPRQQREDDLRPEVGHIPRRAAS